jgi:photosystem II protein PsbQ
MFAVIAVFLVGCSSATSTVKGPDYTPDQIVQIQRYATDITDMRDRFSTDVQQAINTQNWVDVGTIIHGPLGELRKKMAGISRNLTPNLQGKAQDISKDVFEHLVELDAAATANNAPRAIANYEGVIDDIDAFLNLIPNFDALD